MNPNTTGNFMHIAPIYSFLDLLNGASNNITNNPANSVHIFLLVRAFYS